MDDIKTIELTFVNAFLLKVNEGFILIDTGLAMHREKLENELAAEGCLPGNLKLVIVTHGDFDHTGNCAMLQKKYSCKIAMHPHDLPMVTEGVRVRRKMKSFRNKVFFIIRILFKKKFTFDKFSPDILLADGQRLDEYGLSATVLHLPGHTKGSVGILTDEGNLFSGDTFTNNYKPNTASLIENQSDLNNSLSRLKALPVKMIWPGHGKPFDMEEVSSLL